LRHDRNFVRLAARGPCPAAAHGGLSRTGAIPGGRLPQYTVGKVSLASVLEANAGLIADQEAYLQYVVTGHLILIAQAEVSLDPPPVAAGGGAASAMAGAGAGTAAMPPSGGASATSPAPDAGTTTSGM